MTLHIFKDKMAFVACPRWHNWEGRDAAIKRRSEGRKKTIGRRMGPEEGAGGREAEHLCA